MELLHNLGIDWKLLIAQIVNFLVLLFLLKRFLYKPIINTLQKRQERIEDGLKKTRQAEEKLREIEKIKGEEIAHGRKEAQKIVEQALQDSERIKKEKAEEAKKERLEIIEDGRKAAEMFRKKTKDEVKKELGELIVLATARLTKKTLDPKIHQQLIEEAIEDLRKS